MGAPIGIALAGSSGSVSSNDTQSWINTLSNAGLAWYRTINPPSPPPVRGVGIPGSAGSLAPASNGIGQWFQRNLGVIIAIALAGGLILFYRRR